MKCEHFRYGMLENGQFISVTSDGFQDLRNTERIDDDDFYYLRHLGDKAKKETYKRSWLAKPDLTNHMLAFTYIKPTSDNHGRKGHYNHTILIRVVDYLDLATGMDLFKPHFIAADENTPNTLKPINVKQNG